MLKNNIFCLRFYVFFCVFFYVLFFSSGVWAIKNTYINIKLGDVKVITVPDIDQIAIGDETIVNYKSVENGEVVLIGAKAGKTSLHIWQRGGRQRVYHVNVIPQFLTERSRMARYLSEKIPGLEVEEKDSVLIFSGTISPSLKNNYDALLANFPGSVSMVTYRNFDVKPVVKMDVTLLEIKKRAVKELGIEWDTTTTGPLVAGRKTFTRNDYFTMMRVGEEGLDQLSEVDLPNDYDFYHYAGWAGVLGSIIKILQESGDAKVISSPKLMAKSGESASFLSGGQFPIPMTNNLGQTEVEFKEYGVRLEITPQVDENNVINTYIFTELSSIDFGNAVNGVPGVISRNANTTVNLKNGETYAISGLALAQKSNQHKKVPFLGDIPYVGKLFGSDAKDGDTTELVIMVTPYVVTPDDPENTKLIDAVAPLHKEFKQVDWSTSIME